MKKESQEMASKLRNNQECNLKDYKKQAQKAEKRTAAIEQLSQENFVSTVRLKRKHLKAK